MPITLSAGAISLTLNEDLYWADEYTWQPVDQAVERTLTGGMILSTAQKLNGRPITLQPFDENSGWVSYAILAQLHAWAAVPGQQMTLVLRGVSRTVVFRHHEGAAIESTPIQHMSDNNAADFHKVTLRLMEV